MKDDELRARLRAADPARHLSVSHHADLTPPEDPMSITPGPSRPSRGRLVAAAAAVAVLLIAGMGLLLNRGEDPGSTVPAAGDEPGSSASADTFAGTADFTFDAAVQQGRCMPPEPTAIAALDAVFEGTVTQVSDTQVVLEPQKVYKGKAYDRVRLAVERGAAPSEALPVDFRVGRDYVVAVKAGQLQLCGFSGEVNPTISSHYLAVYPNPVTR